MTTCMHDDDEGWSGCWLKGKDSITEIHLGLLEPFLRVYNRVGANDESEKGVQLMMSCTGIQL